MSDEERENSIDVYGGYKKPAEYFGDDLEYLHDINAQ